LLRDLCSGSGKTGGLGTGLCGYLDSRPFIFGKRSALGGKGLLKLCQALLAREQGLFAHLQIPSADEPAIRYGAGAVEVFLRGRNQGELCADLCLKLNNLTHESGALRDELGGLRLSRSYGCIGLRGKASVLPSDHNLDKSSRGLQRRAFFLGPDSSEFRTGGNRLPLCHGERGYDAGTGRNNDSNTCIRTDRADGNLNPGIGAD